MRSGYFCVLFKKSMKSMKKVLKSTLVFALLSLAIVPASAQKFGHLNSGNLLAQLPGTSEADAALKVYQDSLVAIGEEQAKALQTEFEAFYKRYQDGEITPAVAQKKQAEFQQKEQGLIQYEEQVAGLVAAKRQELIEPILVKLQDAINEVAKENGYTMIFDVSVFNTILFAKDADDIEALVKAKMGI